MAGSSSASGATKRLYILATILSIWLLAVCFRLVELQVLKYGEFEQRAQRQQQRTIELSPARGVVYDRNGHELAMSVNVDSVFAVPSEIPDPAMTAHILARVLKTDSSEVLEKIKSGRSFSWVARKLNSETSARIRELNLRGIYFTREPRRYYPKRELAAQVLGYVGLDDQGLGGIEHAYNSELEGRPGTMVVSLDARRKRFGGLERQPEPGQNIVLTIDEKIQYIAERELDAAMQESKAEAGTVVVQNPHTGEILALASRPNFNPNDAKVNAAQLKNHAVTDVYEPGSVFKLVTYSSAIEEGLVKPEDSIDCQNGVIDVNGLRIHDLHKLGVVSVSEALAKSSDVAAVKVGLRLGEDRFYKYIRNYGFGSTTGIELPGETRGLAKPPNRWSKVSIGAMSIGQEIGVTPLQVISMISTIANDGIYTPPRIVAATTKPSIVPQRISYQAPQTRRVISPLTSVEMKKMMEGVVLFGTARRAILDGYTSAGKTGTAQKIDPATHTYSRTKYVASFAGFAPVNSPAISVLVVLDSAQGLHQGGQVSAPVFARIAQQVLSYMHVPHDAEVKSNAQRLLLRAKAKDEELNDSSEHIGEELDLNASNDQPQLGTQSSTGNSSAMAAPATTQRPQASPIAMPGKVSAVQASSVPPKQSPPVPPPAPSSGMVVVDVETGPTTPSFVGKSLRSAIEMAQGAGIEIDAIGSGTAKEQSPPAGSHLGAARRVAVRFAR